MIPERVMRELRYIEIAYRPGDDVRRIDWNVTARLGRPYVRQTHAERELDIVMAIDVSRSMDLGSGGYTKKEVSTFVTASLLFSAGSDNISAGFLAFAERVHAWAPPRRASGRAWRVLEEIWSLEAGGRRTALLPAVRQLAAQLKTMSVVALVSDFITPEDVFGSAELRMLAKAHDVIAIVIEDPADTSLPPGTGYVRMRDVENGEEVVVSLNEHTRRAYAEAIERRRRALRDASYRLGMDLVFVPSGPPVLQPLIELFARRRVA
jgi:uncharacterized protein (DUF58 family)